MSFEITICIKLDIDEYSGFPFVYGANGMKIAYTNEEFRVPEEFRKFVRLSGSHLRNYIGLPYISINEFISIYPKWSEVSIDPSSAWNEDLHDNYFAALLWFAEKGQYFVCCNLPSNT